MTVPPWVYRKEGFCKRIWSRRKYLFAFSAKGVPRLLPLHNGWLKTKNAGDAAQRFRPGRNLWYAIFKHDTITPTSACDAGPV